MSYQERETVYIFVPKTIVSKDLTFKVRMSCGRMAAQAAHISTMLWQDLTDVNIIILSVKDSTELRKVMNTLAEQRIPHEHYTDDDKVYTGELLTAVVTVPGPKITHPYIKSLQTWRCACDQVPSLP